MRASNLVVSVVVGGLVAPACGSRTVELLHDGAACTEQSYEVSLLPSNMLVVLDRSSSMNQRIGGVSRWELARAAIADLVTGFEDSIRFGLKLYPGVDRDCNAGGSSGGRCSPGHVFVDVDVTTTASAIDSVLASARRCNNFGTPTAEALDELVMYSPFDDAARASFVLLITDGRSSCRDPVSSVTALHEDSPAIQTFVVGFGNTVDADQLAATAMAARTALPDPPYYYHADDGPMLTSAFAAIASRARSCSYALSSMPGEGDTLTITVDGVAVPRDPGHTNGWDHDAALDRVTFYGEVCNTLRTANGVPVVTSGCAGPVL